MSPGGMMGGIAGGIFFFSLLAAFGITALYLLVYAAHCFLVVVEQTGAGSDDVVWPDEPVIDWLWKGCYLGWLAAVELVPAWILVRWLAPVETSTWLRWGLMAGVFWLIFPISLLSSQSSTSVLAILRLQVLQQLLGSTRHALAFFTASFLLLLVCLPLAWFSLIGSKAIDSTLLLVCSWLMLMPATALICAACFLLYARLLGRLACLLTPDPGPSPARRPKKELPIASAAIPLECEVPAGAAAEAPSDGETYRMANDESPSPVEIRSRRPGAPRPFRKGDSVVGQEPDYSASRTQRQRDTHPEPLWSSSVWRFPWDRADRGCLCWLTIGSLVVGGLLRLLVLMQPNFS